MSRYENCVVYKIVCKDPLIKESYLDSTDNFTNRKAQHELISKNPNRKGYNLKLYKFIRENGGWDNWDIVVLEEFSCNNKLEISEREWKWDDKVNIELNHIVLRDPAKFQKQYREANKEKIGCRTCKCMVTKNNFNKHTKSKKHINNLP